MDDTSPDAQRRYFQLLSEASPMKRLDICLSLSRATRELAVAGIKNAHEGRTLSDAELRQELARRLYGNEVAQRVFGAAR